MSSADQLVDAIRAALMSDASADARAAGVAACRAVLAAIDPTLPPASPAAAGAAPPSPEVAVKAMVGAFFAAPPDQRLDLLIAALRSRVPPEKLAALPTQPRGPRFQLVPLPRVRPKP